MKSPWIAQGNAEFEPYELKKDDRTQIERQIRHHKIDVPPPGFFRDLESAIARYRSSDEMKEGSKPAVVRANLKKAFDLCLRLESSLEKLDANSVTLIRRASKMSYTKFRERHLDPILNALHEARHAADNFPSRGNLPDEARTQFAADVANAIEKHLDQKPTSTKEGLFESILTIVLKLATGNEVKSTHGLTEKVIKRRKF